MATAAFVALTASAATSAAAVGERSEKYSTLRLCDPTACYIVWSVVDSDHDGVCDADELWAGTDPYDPASRPGLTLLAELLIDRKLPSFEHGLASLVVFPVEIMKAREELGIDLLGAFPMHERGDALTRMGISGDQLSKFGLSSEGGFALGLDGLGSSDAPSGVRVSGIEVSLISAGAKSPLSHVFKGGRVSTEENWQGETVRTYGDGSTETVNSFAGGAIIKIRDGDGNNVGRIEKSGYSVKEGTSEFVYSSEKTLNHTPRRRVDPPRAPPRNCGSVLAGPPSRSSIFGSAAPGRGVQCQAQAICRHGRSVAARMGLSLLHQRRRSGVIRRRRVRALRGQATGARVLRQPIHPCNRICGDAS